MRHVLERVNGEFQNVYIVKRWNPLATLGPSSKRGLDRGVYSSTDSHAGPTSLYQG